MVSWKELMENAGSGNFEPLPSGDYDVEVVKSEPTTSSTGKLMYKVQMKVTGGPHNGRIVFNQFVVSPENANALGFFFTHMRALGLDAAFFSNEPDSATIAGAMVGKRSRVTLTQRDWNGSPRNEVKKMVPVAAGAAAPRTLPSPPIPPQEPQAVIPSPPSPPASPF